MHAHTRFLWYGTLFLLAVAWLAGASGCRARPAIASGVASDSSSDAPVDPTDPTDAGADARVHELLPARTTPRVPASASSPLPPPRAAGVDFPQFKKTSLGLDVLTRLVEVAPELAPIGGSLAMF